MTNEKFGVRPKALILKISADYSEHICIHSDQHELKLSSGSVPQMRLYFNDSAQFTNQAIQWVKPPAVKK